jgi:ADP-heptose:LPS heptosyltransferase
VIDRRKISNRMARENFLSDIINVLSEHFFGVPENKSVDLGNPKKFLIVRQHNQLGDLLTNVSLFRAIKEKYPGCHITIITSPFNYPGIVKNKFIDRIFIFNKTKLFQPLYFKDFIKLLREGYDVAVVPVAVSISFTSNLIAGISKSKIKIGPSSLNGKVNKSAYFFDRRVIIDWRKHPDSNVAERNLDIVRPFGITTSNHKSEISFDEDDSKAAENFISGMSLKEDELLIGLHPGAGKIPNRWSLLKFEELLNRLNAAYKVRFYLTGSNEDSEEINFIKGRIPFEVGLFLNRPIAQIAALISMSDLFISNDTGIMHVAGATDTPQISIFGPTNPFNWAPVGENKVFIRKSDLIDDISTDDVFQLTIRMLEKSKRKAQVG